MKRRLSGWLSIAVLTGGAAGMLADLASAQGWKPERNVELTIPSGPGGSNDIAGRIVQKLWIDLNLLPVSSSIVNRAGGGHVVAYTYVQQHKGDPHYLGIMSTPLLMNHVEGRTPLSYHDVTPIAYLITEPMVAVVRADSPIKTGKDLLDALKKNPAALSIALTSTGHRVSIGMPMQKAGVNIKAVRMPATETPRKCAATSSTSSARTSCTAAASRCAPPSTPACKRSPARLWSMGSSPTITGMAGAAW